MPVNAQNAHSFITASYFGAQAVTPQLMAAFVSAPTPASRRVILAVLQGLEGAAPAAALYPALVQMRQAQPGVLH